MFDRDRFVSECQAALKDAHAERAVREVVARAVDDPAGVLKGLGEPEQGGVQLIHKAPDLTIINVIWSKYMTILPHNHEMWAVIGIYTGREDNIFWRRIKDEAGGRIEAAGAKALGVKDAVPLGKDIIHSVTNPLSRLSGAIHVYGGDFFGVDRSEWNPETLLERPYDVAKNLKILAGANG
jgi:predicted metal-dependent enzyme (double-stranded beta helix superfamily)